MDRIWLSFILSRLVSKMARCVCYERALVGVDKFMAVKELVQIHDLRMRHHTAWGQRLRTSILPGGNDDSKQRYMVDHISQSLSPL